MSHPGNLYISSTKLSLRCDIVGVVWMLGARKHLNTQNEWHSDTTRKRNKTTTKFVLTTVYYDYIYIPFLRFFFAVARMVAVSFLL